MLQALRINNFLLFKNQNISFDRKFTVITGETGSGKSMFIKALRFVLGEKQDIDSDNILVIAEFKGAKNIIEILNENGIEVENDEIIIRRTQNKAFINDVSVTLKFLKTISDELVEFHSQHKQLNAFSKANSLSVIDQFMDKSDLLEKIALLYKQVTATDKEIQELEKEKQQLELDKDHIEYSLKEINSLNPKEGEESTLIEKKKLFNDKVKIISAIEELLSLFKGDDIISKLIRMQRNFSKLESDIDLNELIENSIFHLNELQNQAEQCMKNYDAYESIEDIEERLSKIKELSRKYRCTADQLVDIAKNYQEKLEKFHTIEDLITNKTNQKNKSLKEYFIYAEQLSEKRKTTAQKLSARILIELKQLKLEHVELNIEVSSDQLRPITIKGIDQSRFLIKTNKGFNFAEVNEIASGGELSRIMLAFKVALAESNQKTTIIFDEIDSGTGGAVAETIGNRLKKLAESSQIIAISHQPQVAAKAAQHLLVEKTTDAISQTKVHNLTLTERTQEIARMLSGINISESAMQIATQMIEGILK